MTPQKTNAIASDQKQHRWWINEIFSGNIFTAVKFEKSYLATSHLNKVCRSAQPLPPVKPPCIKSPT
jgi:hypothetical protein